MKAPLFTVFTPTYNRAHTLDRVYQSLLSQTFKDFEWLIVDDGSIDRTQEIVRRYMEDGKVKIRYFHQSNSGKHVAFNCGVREAHGSLFLTLDSDDSCVSNALERFYSSWIEIPEERRAEFSGVTCLCQGESGEAVGGMLPFPVLEGYPYEVMSSYRIKGEKWGFHRTEILKMHPFPVFSGERFVPESLVWNRIGRLYKIKFINEALRYYFSSSDGLSGSMVGLRQSSPEGTFLYYSEALLLSMRFRDLFRISSNLWRFAFHNGQAGRVLFIKGKPLLLALGFVAGGGLFCVDRIKRRNKN